MGEEERGCRGKEEGGREGGKKERETGEHASDSQLDAVLSGREPASNISRVRVLRAAALDAEFAAWYAAYPRKQARGAARKAYQQARKLASAQTLIAALKEHPFPEDRQFIPLPANWLRGERWLDEHPQPAKPNPNDWNPGNVSGFV